MQCQVRQAQFKIRIQPAEVPLPLLCTSFHSQWERLFENYVAVLSLMKSKENVRKRLNI